MFYPAGWNRTAPISCPPRCSIPAATRQRRAGVAPAAPVGRMDGASVSPHCRVGVATLSRRCRAPVAIPRRLRRLAVASRAKSSRRAPLSPLHTAGNNGTRQSRATIRADRLRVQAVPARSQSRLRTAVPHGRRSGTVLQQKGPRDRLPRPFCLDNRRGRQTPGVSGSPSSAGTTSTIPRPSWLLR